MKYLVKFRFKDNPPKNYKITVDFVTNEIRRKPQCNNYFSPNDQLVIIVVFKFLSRISIAPTSVYDLLYFLFRPLQTVLITSVGINIPVAAL